MFIPTVKKTNTFSKSHAQNYFNKQVNEDIENIAIELNNISPSGGAVSSVNGQTGEVVLDKTDIGLEQVDNTSDLEKPVSTAVQSVIDSINIFAGERYAEIQAIQTELGTISPIVENLENIVITGDISGRLDTIEFNITTIQGDITNILNQISALDTRISALENP